MNGKLVTKILGKIMILEGILMALPLIVSIIYDENIYAFLIPMVILIGIGYLTQLFNA